MMLFVVQKILIEQIEFQDLVNTVGEEEIWVFGINSPLHICLSAGFVCHPHLHPAAFHIPWGPEAVSELACQKCWHVD